MLLGKHTLVIGICLSLGLIYLTSSAAQTPDDGEKDLPEITAVDANTPEIVESEKSELISAATILDYAKPNQLYLRSSHVLIVDQREGVHLYGKNIDEPRPIASVTKLMTAMVILDANLPMDEEITITKADRDRLRGSKSRLQRGMRFTREDLLLIALAASENRASKALARTYPGGKENFVNMMNVKAKTLGMTHSRFKDSSGLDSRNVATARDLVLMTEAALKYEKIQKFTTQDEGEIRDLRRKRTIPFINTNRLVRRDKWEIGLSKTGYIADAGHCLVMQAEIGERPVIMVLLNSWGKLSKFGDSNRVKKWLLRAERRAKKNQHIAQTNG